MRKKGKGTVYRIVVRSELTDRYASAFEGMEMETNTTVVNSMIVWHHVLSDEGGRDAADGGSEDGEVVDRGAGGGERMPLGAFRPLRGAPAGARLSARLALGNRAKELLAVGRSGGQRHAVRYSASARKGQLGR